ncbi:class F sortase [Pseudarthrobacter sp. So.54]
MRTKNPGRHEGLRAATAAGVLLLQPYNGAPAGWYNGSPTPGERGPSVMLGHVNALGGATGVFADLHKLTPPFPRKVYS